MEEVEVVIPRFKVATVFAYEQTEGEPLPLLVPEELTASVENYEIFMEAITRVSQYRSDSMRLPAVPKVTTTMPIKRSLSTLV